MKSEKSTGPRTAEGKARSSRNSTVHGLTGKSPILPGEDPADLLELSQLYRDELHPVGKVEEDLVERMAIATYRLRRIARLEVGYFDFRLRYNLLPKEYNKDGGADLLAWAFHVDAHGSKALDRLFRYESCIQREYSRCLRDLQMLQAARKKEICETNSKSKATPVHPTPSRGAAPPEPPAPGAPAHAPAPPGDENNAPSI